jgi:hypothetical protein
MALGEDAQLHDLVKVKEDVTGLHQFIIHLL